MSSTPLVPIPPNHDDAGISPWLKLGLAVGGAILLRTALDALFSSSGRSGKARRSSSVPSVPRHALPLDPAEQLAINRKRGKRFEGVVGQRLQDAFPNTTVISQVTVKTPKGKKRRIDYALAHPNGAITPIEVKNVPELQEKHVRQAEDHRAGLKHTLNVRAGLPIIAVPEDTVVSVAHKSRVRLVRVEGSKSKKRRRKR